MKTTATVLLVLAAASAAPKLGFRNLFQEPTNEVEIKRSPRIIGGQEVVPHTLPYQALVEGFEDNGVSWYCSGAIISRNYVLSTASCVPSLGVIYLDLGIHNFTDVNEPTLILLTTSYWTVHENYSYSASPILNNIALIRFPRTIDYTAAVKPIPLPQDPTNNYAGSLARVSGWGVNSTATGIDQYPGVLKSLTVAVITNEACESYFGPMSSSILCTASEPGVGLCDGDTGNPLVTDGVLIGSAVFTGSECVGSAIGFTRIARFLDWIRANSDVEI